MIYCMFMIISLLSVEVMLFKIYGGKIELFNKVFIYELLENKYIGFFFRCSVFCGIGCNCFNFNLKIGMCFLYNLCNFLYLIVFEIGWRFFIDFFFDLIGEYMLLDYLQIIVKKNKYIY